MSKIKFLITLGSAIRNGAVKTIQQAMAFAKREFGKVDDDFLNDIINVFKKEGKTKKGDVVPIKKQKGLVRRPEEFTTRKDYEKYLDETLGPSDDVFGSPIKEDLLKEWDKVKAKNVTPKEGILAADAATEIVKKRTDDIATGDVTGETSDLMKKIEKKVEDIKKISEDMPQLTDSPFDDFYNILSGGKARDPRRGVVRAAAREILEKHKVKIGKEDPIDMLRKMFGEKGLEALDAASDSLLDAQTYGEMNTILKKNKLFDLVPKKTYGYDQSVVSAEKIRKAKEQEAKNKQILDEFDIDPDREPNAYGGIAGTLRLNRTGYVVGGGIKTFKLAKEIRQSKKYKDFIEMLFIKASNMIRQGKGMWKGLDQKQMMKQHDNLTNEVTNFQKTGELPESVHQYFGMNPEVAYAETLQKVSAGPGKSINISDDAVAADFTNFIKKSDPEGYKKLEQAVELSNAKLGKGRKPNAEGGRVGMAKGGLPNILKL